MYEGPKRAPYMREMPTLASPRTPFLLVCEHTLTHARTRKSCTRVCGFIATNHKLCAPQHDGFVATTNKSTGYAFVGAGHFLTVFVSVCGSTVMFSTHAEVHREVGVCVHWKKGEHAWGARTLSRTAFLSPYKTKDRNINHNGGVCDCAYTNARLYVCVCCRYTINQTFGVSIVRGVGDFHVMLFGRVFWALK